ncbi:IS1 family transposase [uncultured Thiothrix sp.]
MRIHIKRLMQRAICFSKSSAFHHKVIEDFINR